MLPSRYQVIWETLKSSPSVSVKLAAPPLAHARLKKAIKKRKDIDTGYKLILGEENKEAKLSFKSSASLLIVTLNISIRSTWL